MPDKTVMIRAVVGKIEGVEVVMILKDEFDELLKALEEMADRVVKVDGDGSEQVNINIKK